MRRRARPTQKQIAPTVKPARAPIDARLRWSVAAAATVAAMLERWWFPRAWGEAASLTSAFYYGDAPRFVDYALAILDGRTFDNGIPFHPPGWPIVLAAFLRLAGVHGADTAIPVGAVKLFVACLSGLSVGVTTLAAYEIAGGGAMLAVALLAPFHFGHIVEGTVANSEALYGLFVAATIWTASRWLRAGSGSATALACTTGALAGLASLVRPEFVAAAVVLAAAVFRTHRSAAARQVAAFALIYFAVLTPSTIWHWRTIDAFNRAHVGRVAGPLPRFAPVTSYGPFNFAMANHENADGGPNRDHPLLDRCNEETEARLTAGQLDIECAAVYDVYVHGYRIGLAWMLRHPIAAANLLTSKVAFTAGFLAQGYLIDDVGASVDGVRRRVDLFDPASWTLVPLHLALIAIGVWTLRRDRVSLTVVCAAVVPLVAATLLFYGYVRLGAAYLPAIWILEGAGIASSAAWLWKGTTATARTAAWVMAIIALLTAWEQMNVGKRAVALDGPRTESGALIQDETVEIRKL